MLCLVDGKGNLLLGKLQRSSEFTTHLAIYDNVPEAAAVVHAHPVHATAFAILGLELPERLLPEIEVCVGRVPLAPYATPGSPDMYRVTGPFAPKHQAILMANHGLICWGCGVENAYFKMEITDTYCRTIAVASQMGGRGTFISHPEMAKFFELKKRMGLPDGREGRTPAELWSFDPWKKLAGDMRKKKHRSTKSASNGA
jgi:L-fuculose-phosphate aldolase